MLCEEWDAASGGNRALVFAGDQLAAAAVPQGDAVLLPDASGVDHAQVDVSDYDEARTSWCATSDRVGREVLGQLGGEPSWLQNDEVPDCASCAKPMNFVAQLEEGYDYRTEINFGGGCGYAFACRPCGQGAFLWQC